MASFSDNFNRANGGVGSDWTTLTGMSGLNVISNEVNAAGLPSAGAHVATATATFAADHETECVITAFNEFDRAGPAVRLNGDDGYIARALSSTFIQLFRMDGATLTDIGTGGGAYVVGDTIRIRAEGTTITVYANDVEILTATDATHSSGQPGLYYAWGDSNSTRLDDFYAEDISGPPEPAPPRVLISFRPPA
jgi:hypothetical protein